MKKKNFLAAKKKGNKLSKLFGKTATTKTCMVIYMFQMLVKAQLRSEDTPKTQIFDTTTVSHEKLAMHFMRNMLLFHLYHCTNFMNTCDMKCGSTTGSIAHMFVNNCIRTSTITRNGSATQCEHAQLCI